MLLHCQASQASIAEHSLPATSNRLAKWDSQSTAMAQANHPVQDFLGRPTSDWKLRPGSRKDHFMDSSQWWDDGMNEMNPESRGINPVIIIKSVCSVVLHTLDQGEEFLKLEENWCGLYGEKSHVDHAKQKIVSTKTRDYGLKGGFAHSTPCHKLTANASEAQLLESSTWEILNTGNALNILESSTDLPSIEDCICILQECRKEKHPVCAKRVLAYICIIGLEAHTAIGNHIVPMFVDCGNVPYAEQVLDRLIHRNEHSWTSVILGYTQSGYLQHALNLYQRMLEDRIYPSNYTHVGLLKACADVKDMERGRKLHVEIVQKAFEKDLFVGSTLVYMYAKCSSLSEAQEVFDMLPVRNVVSWTALISGYAENGPHQEALNLFEQMKHDDLSPNSWTFACVLRTCGILGATDKGRKLHLEVSQKGFGEDPYVGNALVCMYARLGFLSEAQKVFDKLLVQDIVSWNVLIAGYAEYGLDQEIRNCFERMRLDGISPNAATFAYVVKACGSLGSIEKGLEVHKEIVRTAAERDPSIANCLIGMYAKCGFLSEAWKVFDQLPAQSVISWTALIGGYAEHGYGEEALKCLEQMQQVGLSPDAVTLACSVKACSIVGATEKGWELHKEVTLKGFDTDLSVGIALVGVYANYGSVSEAHEIFKKLPARDVVSWTALIAGYTEQGCVQEAIRFFDQMQVEGLIPDAVTYACILKVCGSTGAIEKGRELHMDILLKEFERDSSISNSIIGMYAKCGLLVDAQKVFDKLLVRDIVSWTLLASGYAEHGPNWEALKCFELMQLEGVCGDAVIFACCLKACGSIGVIDEGQKLHSEIALDGFEKDPVVGNTLVGMYSKCGLFLEAVEVFDNLPAQDVVSWNALIAGYAEHEHLGALACLEQMQVDGVCPDAVTLACALKACGSIGAIERGRGMHSQITLKGFQGDPSLGNCLISMYAKCGSLSEAHDVFDSLPVRDVVAWSTMIKGYGMNHDGHISVRLFEDMQEYGVKPHSLVFSCLLTSCSHSSLILKGQEYFKVMREDFGIAPTEEHYSCMVDLLARSGHLYEAEKFLEVFCPPSEGTWAALLSACKTFEEPDLGLRCFQQLVQINPNEAAWYVLMADINASSSKWNFTNRLEELRKHAGVKKKPASALIEVNKRVHEFVVGNNLSHEISAMLKAVNTFTKAEGHVPKLNLVLKPIADEEKEAVLCEHAEKLAIAFGLLNTPQGETLRVTKSLRMCNDCHDTSKIISKVENREIILRDNSCIHHFKGGLCSCGDMF